ncbi:AsmA family protein [Hyphomicrobium denitrificans]|nr:AsmA family protein [Hyphomicrobium denitrificans]
MNNGLLFFGGLLVLVLAALFAVPTLVDWNGYRGVFEEEASKVLGRDVRVGGAVNLRFLPAPYVQFDKVRIANVSGQTGEPFVRADSFKMWLSGPALLRGVLEASEIELNKPVLTLAVDKSGGGNWTNITLRSADLPFVPRELALKSVKLSDGTISIYNAAAERIAHIENINGELSADGLAGPFRFKGNASWLGAARDIAFATEAPASDGSFGLKVSARSIGSPDVYLLNGRVSDLARKPSFKGEWAGTLTMPADKAPAHAGKDDTTLLDLKAEVSGDTSGAKFDDITLSLNSAALPQMITGSAVATWMTPPRLDLTLASKWLDIDRLAGAGQGSASFSKLKELGLGLMQSVAGDSTARAKINLEQVKIGGETAGGLDIDADRTGNITHIKNFNISLPGGSRLDLAGNLKTDAEGKHSFSGDLFVGGTSLARLKAWAGKSGVPIDITSDGPFSLSGKLDIDATRFAIADASGDISGRAFSGDLTVAQGVRLRTDLTLQAAELDTKEIFPETASTLETALRKALGLVLSDSEKGDAAGEHAQDVRLRVIAGRLIDHGNKYRDVDVTFETEGKEIRLPAAKMTTESGLRVSLEGRVKKNDDGPFGTLAYDVVAPTPDAMSDLVRKSGLALQFGDEPFKGLKSAKLAGLIKLGRRTPSASDVTFDGTLNGSHFGGSADFDGGLGAWRSRPSRVQMTVSAPSLQSLLTMLAQDQRMPETAPGEPAEASLISAGTLASGAKARLEIRGHGLDVAFSGSAVWPEGSSLALNGAADVKADDLADALAMAGLSLPAGSTAVATHGTLDVIRDKGTWSIAARDLMLGTSTVTAFLDLKNGEDGRRNIEGKIGADRVAIEALAAALTDKSSVPPDSGDTGVTADGSAASEWHSIWPSGLFNFAALNGSDADIHLSFGSLALSGDLATRDGEMKLAISPSKITVSDLSAAAAGGKLSGSLRLDKASNGVTFVSHLKLDQAKLSSFSPSARGTATFELNGEATAQSPAGLIAVLSGKGHVTLQGATVHGPVPTALADIVDTVLRGKMQNDPRAISAALLTSLTTSEVSMGNRELAMTLADGSIKFETLALESPDGKLEATASADLTSLKASAALQVTPTLKPLSPPDIALPGWKPPPPKGPLPPAIVLYDGPLDNLAVVKSSVDVADLQRELSVRQVERNVEELELSRRVDEERARIEKERRKALDAQRAQAAKKQTGTLPPVVPESAGTTNGGQSGADPVPDATVPNPPVIVPQADKQDGSDATGSASSGTLQGQKITVEPIPDSESVAAQSSAGQIDPETGLPVPDKNQEATRSTTSARPAQRPREKRRTSSDEVMKQLGGFQ